MKIYEFDSDSESYEVVATISQEGVVTGDSPFAQRVRCGFEQAEDRVLAFGVPRHRLGSDRASV